MSIARFEITFASVRCENNATIYQDESCQAAIMDVRLLSLLPLLLLLYFLIQKVRCMQRHLVDRVKDAVVRTPQMRRFKSFPYHTR